MKKTLVKILVALFVISMPLGTMAASHGHGDHGKKASEDKKGHEGHGHGSQEMQGGMAMLGDEVKEGVKGAAHLKDVSETMAKLDRKENYHFMIMFMDTQTGKPIEEGTVAVKITDPKGKEIGAPVELLGMDGHFGADIALTEKGEYHFKVGSKLPDGKKRQHHFHYLVK
ncbi:MAG: hypothetical protein ACYDAI_11880 [Trichloromonadaceae bacterium]